MNEGDENLTESYPASTTSLKEVVNNEILSVNRTRMAADRTLMSWIRTSLSMISFGFTIYKFIEAIQEKNASPELSQHAPRIVGLTLIGMGTFALIMACLEYLWYINKLGLKLRSNPWDMTFIIAFLLGLLGALMFASIIINAGPFR